MLEWMTLPYKRYADFKGRSRRKEYWSFVLLLVIVYAVLMALMVGGGLDLSAMTNPAMASQMSAPGPLFYVGAGLLGIFVLASFIPMIAGVFVIGIGGLKPGLDFKSGTKITAVFQQAQPNDGQVRSALSSAGFGDAKVQTFTRTIPSRCGSDRCTSTRPSDRARPRPLLFLLASMARTMSPRTMMRAPPSTLPRQVKRVRSP